MRRHILAGITGVAAIAVLILGIPLGVAVTRLYSNEEIVRLEREAAVAMRTIDTTTFGSGDPVELPRASRHLSVAVYGVSGQRIVGKGPRLADAVVKRALRGSVGDNRSRTRLAVALPIARQETVIGAIRASTPGSVVTDRAHRAWLAMTAIGLTAVVVAALIGFLLARRLTVPVEALAESARRLGDGDFAGRSPRSGVGELDAVAKALDATAARLGTALERERRFSSDASHQLRTPIAAVRVQLESARLDPNADPAAAIAAALPQLDRLESTVDELLALARGGQRDAPPVAVHELLDDLAGEWRGRLARDGRPLIVRVATEMLDVHVSRSTTRQILEVLVDNAARHGAGAVSLSARLVAGNVFIEVADEGRGVEGNPDAIWRRGVGHGHGIGLALARSLAEADGGRLVLERARPHPMFSLVLPTRAAPHSSSRPRG